MRKLLLILRIKSVKTNLYEAQNRYQVLSRAIVAKLAHKSKTQLELEALEW